MRTSICIALFVAACATPGASTRAPAPPAPSPLATRTVDDLIRGDYAAALADAERALEERPGDPWLLYNKGVALAGVGRVEESLPVLRAAEAGFTDPHDQSLAAYRRALTLEFAGRCAEASTEYSRYARLVREEDPKLADEALAHLRFCVTPTVEERAAREERAHLAVTATDGKRALAESASTDAVKALVRGDYADALAHANAGLSIAPDDPWLLYNAGAALAGLGRVEESLDKLAEAEHRFSVENLHGRSVATYRRALALEVAGRCKEEKAELDHFAALVGYKDPQFAEHARAHVRFCQIANRIF